MQKKPENDIEMQTKSNEDIISISEKQNENVFISQDEMPQHTQAIDCCKTRSIPSDITYDTDGSAGSNSLKIMRVPKPFYPQESRKSKEEGEVIVAVAVSSEGKIQSISIAVSSGFQRLDEAALKAAKKIRLSREMGNSNEDIIILRVPYKFKIV